MSEQQTYNFFDALELAKAEIDEHKNINEVHPNLICTKYAPQGLQQSLEALQNDLALLAAEASPGFMIHDVVKATVVRVMRENLYIYLAEKQRAADERERNKFRPGDIQITPAGAFKK